MIHFTNRIHVGLLHIPRRIFFTIKHALCNQRERRRILSGPRLRHVSVGYDSVTWKTHLKQWECDLRGPGKLNVSLLCSTDAKCFALCVMISSAASNFAFHSAGCGLAPRTELACAPSVPPHIVLGPLLGYPLGLWISSFIPKETKL